MRSDYFEEEDANAIEGHETTFIKFPPLPKGQCYSNTHFNKIFNDVTKEFDIKPPNDSYLKPVVKIESDKKVEVGDHGELATVRGYVTVTVAIEGENTYRRIKKTPVKTGKGGSKSGMHSAKFENDTTAGEEDAGEEDDDMRV